MTDVVRCSSCSSVREACVLGICMHHDEVKCVATNIKDRATAQKEATLTAAEVSLYTCCRLDHHSVPMTIPIPFVRPSRNTKRVPAVRYSGRCRNRKRTQARSPSADAPYPLPRPVLLGARSRSG